MRCKSGRELERHRRVSQSKLAEALSTLSEARRLSTVPTQAPDYCGKRVKNSPERGRLGRRRAFRCMSEKWVVQSLWKLAIVEKCPPIHASLQRGYEPVTNLLNSSVSASKEVHYMAGAAGLSRLHWDRHYTGERQKLEGASLNAPTIHSIVRRSVREQRYHAIHVHTHLHNTLTRTCFTRQVIRRSVPNCRQKDAGGSTV